MAEMTAASINDLPDSAFAYIEPGGKKVDGKTEPRSLRHFPIHDKAHVRNALARLSQSEFGGKARAKVEAAARKFGIGEPAEKALFDMKAEPMSSSQLDKWLQGKIPRRILMLPFGGPLPGGKAGLDIDGEYFDEATDIYGPYPSLKASRERVVDWHHDDSGVPSGKEGPGQSMKGAIIGHLQFDEDPEADGYWADWWANAGEKRRRLIGLLERKGVPLFGSTQSVKGARLLWPPEADGHITTWPVIRHTISTSPQNTYAVVPALKAVLGSNLDEIPADALKALLTGLDAPTTELLLSSAEPVVTAPDQPGETAVMSEAEEAKLASALDALGRVIPDLSQLVMRKP